MEMTREELKQVMREVMLEILDERAPQKVNMDKEWLSVDEAVLFLDNNGFSTTKKYLYLLCHNNTIPYSKSNGKSIFNRDVLREFAQQRRTCDPEKSRRNAAERLAKVAECRERRQIKTE